MIRRRSAERRLTPGQGTSLAFTVVELMVAVSLMTVIVLALFGMFRQTQRALQGNVTQLDVLESGRAALELMVREVQEAVPAGLEAQVNFKVELNRPGTLGAGAAPMFFRQPLLQTNVHFQTNVLQEVFFLTKRAKEWTAVGYRVVATNGPVGVLYRFAYTTNAAVLPFAANNLSLLFHNTVYTNRNFFTPVADGVLHLRVQTADRIGRPLNLPSIDFYYPPAQRVSLNEQGLPSRALWLATSNSYPYDTVVRQWRDGANLPFAEDARFLSNAVPAYVDLELGVLEPQTLEQYRAFQVNPALATNFLARQAAKVHLFRQRIPIPSAPL